MIDLRTVVFSYAISTAICAIVIALLWRQNRKRFAGPGFWLAGFVAQFVAILMAPMRGILPNIASVVLPNALLISGAIFILIGLEQFAGRRASQTHNYLLLAAFVAVHAWYTFVQPSLLAREIDFSLALIVIMAQCAWLMLYRVETGLRPAARGLGNVFLAIGVLAVLRIVVDLVVDPGNTFWSFDSYDTLYLFANQMLLIILPFNLFLLVNRRIFKELEDDVDKYRQMDQIIFRSEQHYRSLFENMLDGFAYCKMLYQDGKPQDFIYLEVNQAFEELTGLSNVQGKKVSEVLPGIQVSNPELFDIYEQVATTGRSDQSEIYLASLGTWFLVSVYSNEPGYFAVVFENISIRKGMEDALRTSQSMAEELYEGTPDALVTVDARGRITRINSQAKALFGYTGEELLNQPVEILIPQSLQAGHKNHRSSYFRQPRARAMGASLELSALRKDGSTIPVEIQLSPLQIGGETFVTADIRDILERKLLDQALRYRTNVLEALHQVTLDLVNRHEMDDILQTLLVKIGALLDASDISFDLVEHMDTLVTYAVTPGQPLKKGDQMRRGEGGWLSWQAIDTGQPTVLEDYATWPQRRLLFEEYPIHAIMIVPVRQRDQISGTINISRSMENRPFNDSDIYVARELAQMVALVLDNAQLYGALNTDIAQRIQNETALREMQTQVIDQQRRMATIEERQRMARDLHDSVNQSIHSLVLFSETLVSTLEKDNVARALEISGRLQESARQALKETRLLLYQTRAPLDAGNLDLLEELNTRLATVEQRAGVRAHITLEGSLQNCPEAWYENLFWIAIEALNNSLKHAQARSVRITIRSFQKFLELEIFDNGKGFDTARPRTGGYGLQSMRERADLLGGKLTLISVASEGTRVLLRIEIEA